MDDTGLPISTSRVSTVPVMGARMVALRSSSSARSTAARACATCAPASVDAGAGDDELAPGAALLVLGHVAGALGSSSCDCEMSFCVEEALGALEGAAGELDVGPLGLDEVLVELRACRAEVGLRRLEVGFLLSQAGRQLFLVEFGEDVARHRPGPRRRSGAPR